MKRQFILNILLLLFINLSVKPGYIFFIEAEVQNILGNTAYGFYFFHLNFVFLFQFVNDMGIQTWNAQFIPKNKGSVDYFIPRILSLKILLSSAYIIISFLFAFFIGGFDLKIILLTSLNLALSAFFIYLRTNIAGMGFYKIDSLLSSLDKILMIIIIGILIYGIGFGDHFSIFHFIYGQSVSLVIANVVALIILGFKVNIWPLSWDFKYFLSVLKLCLPYILVFFLMVAYNKIDGVMLGKLLNDGGLQAGIYAGAFRFYEAANMIGYMFAGLLLPMFSSIIGKNENVSELKVMSLRWISFFCLPIVVCLHFYAQDLLNFIYTTPEETMIQVLKYLAISFGFVAISYIYGTMMVAADKINKLQKVFILGLVINVILNWYWIPNSGAVGAAKATLITQGVVMLGQIWVTYDYFKIRFLFLEYLRLISFLILLVFITYFISAYLTWDWYIKVLASIFISLPLGFGFKILLFKDFKILSKQTI